MNDTARVLKEWFGIGWTQALVLATLYRANGQVVSYAKLWACGYPSRSGMRQCIARIRRAMDEGAVETAEGVGYRLTRDGLKDCDGGLLDAIGRAAA